MTTRKVRCGQNNEASIEITRTNKVERRRFPQEEPFFMLFATEHGAIHSIGCSQTSLRELRDKLDATLREEERATVSGPADEGEGNG